LPERRYSLQPTPVATRSSSTLDALSHALNAVRMTGAIFFNAEFTAPWGFAAPAVETLAPLLAPGTERLVIYHLITDGEALARIAGTPDVPLTGGDIVIIPHGDAHVVCSGSPSTLLDSTASAFGRIGSGDLSLKRFGGGGAATRFVCGFFGCERHAERLFLAGLPPIIKVNVRGDEAGAWLESSIRHLVGEAEAARPGRAALLSKMAEALFIEALRRYMACMPPGHAGWLAAAADPVVGRVLALLHRDPGHAWSMADIAAQAAASRSVITERFAQLLGEPPLGYLARWRLQLAARLLETTRKTLAQIASEVGYESEAAFSRAFKRAFGLPPARYRKRSEQQGALHRGTAGSAG
jgi:AraC-like DNA-binding protein